MARRLPGQPEDYMTAKLAREFRAKAAAIGVPPVMYLTAETAGMPARYSGDEFGMTITGAGIVIHMCAGLRALHLAKPEGSEP